MPNSQKPEVNLDEEKENIEHILHDAKEVLYENLMKFMLFSIKHESDPNRMRVEAFCQELEALKKVLSDNNEKLSVRIDTLGKIAAAFEHMIHYSNFCVEDKPGLAARIKNMFSKKQHQPTSIKDLLNDYIALYKNHDDDYFNDCKVILEKIVKEHPTLLGD